MSSVKIKTREASSKTAGGLRGRCKPPSMVRVEASGKFAFFDDLFLIWAILGASELDVDRM